MNKMKDMCDIWNRLHDTTRMRLSPNHDLLQMTNLFVGPVDAMQLFNKSHRKRKLGVAANIQYHDIYPLCIMFCHCS